MASNVDVVRGIYDAFAKGDVGAVLGAMDEKIDWREPESLPFESQIGPQAVAENVFAKVLELVADFSVAPDELHEADDIVFALGTYRGKGAATGSTLEAPFVHVWRMKDGKVAAWSTHTDTHVWLKALGQT